MVELLHALNKEGHLVHVNDVPNGLNCMCTCPACGRQLIARNNGETITPHFAHREGMACNTAHETELHLLAKEIIEEEKCVMLPPYGNVFNGAQQHFNTIEVERRSGIGNLQPDLCGIAKRGDKESRLWIEIRVTHPVDANKRTLILQHRLSCIEIDLSPFMDQQVTREELREFILNSKSHTWVNNPVLEDLQHKKAAEAREKAQSANAIMLTHHDLQGMSPEQAKETIRRIEQEYLNVHPAECIIQSKKCLACKHHTTHQALMDEIKRRALPSWLREALSCNLTYWKREELYLTLRDISNESCKGYCIQYDRYLHLLPLSSPDMHGYPVSDRQIRQNNAIVPFLQNVVPDIIDTYGLHCKHNRHTFPSLTNTYDIACDMPTMVKSRRKKKL